MTNTFKYLYYSFYEFYGKYSPKGPFTHLSPSITLSFLISFNVLTLLSLVLLLADAEFNANLFPGLGLFVLFASMFLLKRKEPEIVADLRNRSKQEKSKLRVWSITYVVITMVMFIVAYRAYYSSIW